jgi:hypothetical protein
MLLNSILFALPIIGAVNAAAIAPRNNDHKEPAHEVEYVTVYDEKPVVKQ